MSRWGVTIETAQGLFFITGVWPLVQIRSFLRVTGPKTDLWLVKTVGVLVAVISAVLAVVGSRGRVPSEAALLGAGAAPGLAGIDVWYVARRVIPRSLPARRRGRGGHLGPLGVGLPLRMLSVVRATGPPDGWGRHTRAAFLP